MRKIGMTVFCLMLLSACGTINKQQPDYIVNTIIPRAQPEDKKVDYPVCKNEKTGDVFDCERLWKQKFCLLAKQYDIFMRRATKDKHQVEIPETCLFVQQ